MEQHETMTMEQIAMRVSKTSILVNTLLSLAKLAAGILASSEAMISDAVHSASDVFSTFVVIIGIKMAGKKADKEHPYGHERMECVAAVILATILAFTGLGIGYTAVVKILSGNYENIMVPGCRALGAAVVSIAVKEGMYWYTIHAAVRIQSGALKADAWHHRSDALSSVGSFISSSTAPPRTMRTTSRIIIFRAVFFIGLQMPPLQEDSQPQHEHKYRQRNGKHTQPQHHDSVL